MIKILLFKVSIRGQQMACHSEGPEDDQKDRAFPHAQVQERNQFLAPYLNYYSILVEQLMRRCCSHFYTHKCIHAFINAYIHGLMERQTDRSTHR